MSLFKSRGALILHEPFGTLVAFAGGKFRRKDMTAFRTRETQAAAQSQTPVEPPRPPDIAILVYCLEGGGVQRQTLTLASAFAARGLRVAYVVVRATGVGWRPAVHCERGTGGTRCRAGGRKKPTILDRIIDQIHALPALTVICARFAPRSVLTGGSHMNFSAAVTHRMARSAPTWFSG